MYGGYQGIGGVLEISFAKALPKERGVLYEFRILSAMRRGREY